MQTNTRMEYQLQSLRKANLNESQFERAGRLTSVEEKVNGKFPTIQELQ